MTNKLDSLNQMDRIEYLIYKEGFLIGVIYFSLMSVLVGCSGLGLFVLGSVLDSFKISLLGYILFILSGFLSFLCLHYGKKWKKRLDSKFFEVKPKIRKK